MNKHECTQVYTGVLLGAFGVCVETASPTVALEALAWLRDNMDQVVAAAANNLKLLAEFTERAKADQAARRVKG